MKTPIILLLLPSVLAVSCADLAADCERLGTCAPAELEGGLPKAPLGASCGAASACQSGFCVERVGCDTGCDPACGTSESQRTDRYGSRGARSATFWGGWASADAT